MKEQVTRMKTERGLIVKRTAETRGRTNFGWLHSRHTFSFGEYYDPAQMGFRSLRVINDDIVDPGAGFGAHPHKDAEIFSYVIAGQLQHKDSLGNGSVVNAGELQYMSAGRGVVHSEFNPSDTRAVHFLQVWLKPNVTGGEPRYAQKPVRSIAKPNALTLILSGEKHADAIEIRQDADVYFGRLDQQQGLSFAPGADLHVWIQVIQGRLQAFGEILESGDGAAVTSTQRIDLSADVDSEFLLFNLR